MGADANLSTPLIEWRVLSEALQASLGALTVCSLARLQFIAPNAHDLQEVPRSMRVGYR
jgi:hypothetical protein